MEGMSYDRTEPRWSQTRAPWWATRSTPDPGAMRVSNDEREAVVTALITHWSDGRLDEPTFDERAARARTAVTRADLDRLLWDLPARDLMHGVPDMGRRRQRRFASPTILLLVAFFLVVLGAITAAANPHVPWLVLGLIAVVLTGRSRRRHHRHRF